MYIDPRWSGGNKGKTSARARQVPVGAHEGSDREFLRRHERHVSTVRPRSRREREQLAGTLFERLTDSRNLALAFQTLKRQGGQTPGPDHLSYAQLSTSDIYTWAREARRALLDGSYRPGEARALAIPKSSGKGTRTIQVTSILDRAIQRAITQVLQPYLDPIFLPGAIGYRPDRNTHDALALAERYARQGLRTWICEDIRNAFDQIPQQRLLDVLGKYLPGAKWQTLLRNILHTAKGRGIPQGGCLSPLLLNLYLHHHLDQHWRGKPTPLIRVADDLLILCRSEEVARDTYKELTQRLTPAGMPLKGSRDTTNVGLGRGEQATWLGFSLGWTGTELEYSITEKAWNHLEDSLRNASQEANPIRKARETLRSWVNYLGPCYQEQHGNKVYSRIQCLLPLLGLEEALTVSELKTWWSAAHARWCRFRKKHHQQETDQIVASLSLSQGKESDTCTLTAPPVAPPLAGTSVFASNDRSIVPADDGHSPQNQWGREQSGTGSANGTRNSRNAGSSNQGGGTSMSDG